MDATRCGRVLFLVLNIVLATAEDVKYVIPEVTIEAFIPKGFRASIPGSPNQSLFAFQGNVNRKIESDQVGALSGETLAVSSDGRWIVDLPDVQLKAGDTIKFFVFAAIDRVGYVRDNMEFTITELKPYVPPPAVSAPLPTLPPPTTTPPPECKPTLTRLSTGTACAGQVVFEENFDTLRESVWQVEHYIPIDHPEVPFVSYQKSAVSVKDGVLSIKADLQQTREGFTNETITQGSLNLLQECTSYVPQACELQASGANILPPVVSGRIISKPGFAFTYGTVSVRAKLPLGDWLYPEILLEPFRTKYGSQNYKSGLVKIANAYGNVQLFESNGKDHGNKYLYGGAIASRTCREAIIGSGYKNTNWANDFHIFSVKWTPESLTFMVDGKQYYDIASTSTGLCGHLLPNCGCTHAQPGLAPLDDHFYLTLGLVAGGVNEFQDLLTTTGGRIKPWTNVESKAALKFWQHQDFWHPTWLHPELLVDYIKVEAL